MRVMVMAVVMMGGMVSGAYSQYGDTTYEIPNALTLEGTVIDNASVDSHKENLGDYAQNYAKDDAATPEAIASGYSIYASGRLFKFDKESNVRIADFLKADFNKPQVIVVARQTENGLHLVSIKNQGEY